MGRNLIYKLKTAGIVVGVAIPVCIGFKFLMPAAAPFIFAFLFSLLLNGPVDFMEKKLHLKRPAVSAAAIIFGGAVLAAALIFGGRSLIRQINRLMENYDGYAEKINRVADDYCCRIDEVFNFKKGTSYDYAKKQVEKSLSDISDSALASAVSRSVDFMAGFTVVFTAITIAVMAAFFFLKDMNKIKINIRKSLFGEELSYLGTRMKEVLGTYLKTQLVIMGLTCGICTLGLYIMGNRYAFLIGFVIGIVDAFPILGTGTVFLPWCVVLLFMRKFRQAVYIFVIYIICYYMRQFLEPKLMGNSLGISPVMMLATIYAGMLMFGITGVFTGPVAYVLIKEISGIIIKNL